MKIKTKELQNLLPIIRSVVGNNDLNPITTYIGIKTTSDSIVFYAVGRDKLKLSLKIDNPDPNIDISLNANLFLGLLSKITTEEIELTINTDTKNLIFKGNGVYNLPIMYSELEKPISFSDLTADNLNTSIGTLTKDFIQTIINNNSFALLKVKESESLGRLSTGNYHTHPDKTMTSDGNTISKTILNSGLTNNLSISPTTMTTLNLFGEDVAVYDVGSNNIYIKDNFILYSPKVADPEQFPFDNLDNIIQDSLFNLSVSIDKAAILSTIDRLNLFSDDNSALNITFGNNTVEFSINEQKESIVSNGDGQDYKFVVKTIQFTNAIKVIDNENIIFKFNKTNADVIRLDNDNLIIGLASKAEEDK